MTTSPILHTAPELADVPARTVLVVDGSGAPASDGFQAAVSELYGALGTDAPLEGTWWSGDDPFTFDLADPDGWNWTAAVAAPADQPAPPAPVRRERRDPQRVVRLIHHGPYEDEGPSLAALHAFAAEQGLEPTGPHTEVYLTDPRSTAPAELRTELRLPVR